MKRFKTVTEIPRDGIVAPSLFFAPRQGSKPIGSMNGWRYYCRQDVSELRTRRDWERDGRTIKAGEKPLVKRREVDPVGVYADWQTE
jgi:hypothetical protein